MEYTLKEASIVLEDFMLDIRSTLDSKDQVQFMKFALEATNDPTQQAYVMDILYKDLDKLNSINLDKISDSKGDITKFTYYSNLLTSIEAVGDLADGAKFPNLESLNTLHSLMLELKPDFTFGYKVNNPIITSMYELLVASLYEMVSIVAVDCTVNLRKKLNPKDTTKSITASNNICVKGVNSFIKMHSHGEWTALMKVFRSNYKEFSIVATEAADGEKASLWDTVKGVLPSAVNVLSGGNVDTATTSDFVDGVGKIKDNIDDSAGGTVVKGIGAFFAKVTGSRAVRTMGIAIGVLMIIRMLVKYFFKAAFSINQAAKTNAAIIRAKLESGMGDDTATGTANGIESQKKVLKFLDGVSDVITYKIFKANKEAEVDLAKSNREDLSPQAVRTVMGNFEL